MEIEQINGFLHLIQQGIVKRKVYEDVHIQKLINEERLTEDLKPDHLDALIPILKSGDLNAFISIVEREALTLHAMMMCSDPYFILMKPNTLEKPITIPNAIPIPIPLDVP